MSVAAEAVAFLGAEGVITTTATALLGWHLVRRASVAAPPKPSANGNGSRASGNGTGKALARAEAAREPIDVPIADIVKAVADDRA